jgi:hypothetical protein
MAIAIELKVSNALIFLGGKVVAVTGTANPLPFQQ